MGLHKIEEDLIKLSATDLLIGGGKSGSTVGIALSNV